jgi:hypothetical protein
LVHVLDVLGVESIGFAVGEQCDELFPHWS